MTHLLIQNIIGLSRRSQQHFGMPICKAIRRPQFGSETAERKTFSNLRTAGSQNEAPTDFWRRP